MHPDSNFITSLFNILPESIDSFLTRTSSEKVIYEITLKRTFSDCPFCNGKLIGYGHKSKIINHPVLLNRQCYIQYNANRYRCKACGRTMFEHNPFALSGFNSSTLLLQQAMQKLRNLNYTLDMISKELNISTTQLNNYLDSFITIPKRPLPECIGIDEIHSKALSKRISPYLCILVDNEKRCIFDILDSRAKFSLSRHFSSIPREERLRVKYVTIDMWEPYRDLAQTYFPNAVIAVDSFHVIEHLVKDFDRLRIDLMKRCDYHSNGYYLLKKWSWLLEKDSIDFDNPKVFNHRFGTELNRRDMREIIFSTFPILQAAYQLKELYRKFNQIPDYEEACRLFPKIKKYFSDSNIPQYDEFSGLLERWQTEILNSFLRPYEDNRRLSNAYTENLNGKIRTYIDVSRGIKNFDRFRKRVIYALNPEISYALTMNLHSEKYKGKTRGSYLKPID